MAMRMAGISKRTKAGLGLMAVVCGAGMLQAQTLATGDARTVTEPVFPATCTVLTAQQAIVSGQPASETVSDTTRIQAALTGCAAGQAVELAASGANYAFLSGPLNLPTGVSLIIDGGVTLFASRFAADYQTSSSELCGTYGSNGNGCNNFLQFAKGSTNANSGIYGYGVIDGRGGSTILKLTSGNVVDTGTSWWTNADQANTAGSSQDNPILMKPAKSTNLTLYKMTFRNSPMFHIGTSGVNGFTAWGVKIQAPFTAHNTDGIDPQGTNVTITNSSISDGDDEIAVGASSASSNVTISNVTTYSGHGISVGSYTQGGLNNMLVKNVNMAGASADGNETGLRLKSAADRGALVQNITYQNVCMRDVRYPIIVTGYYNTNSGTAIPTFSNIVYQNVHVLPPTATKYPYKLQLQGYDASHLSTLTWNNLVIESLIASNVVGTTTTSPTNTTITLQNNVYPSFLQTLTGSGVSETGSATATTTGAYDCSATATIFPYIVGELYASTPTATNLQTASVNSGVAVTLNAMVQPAMSQITFNGTVGNYTGAAALTAGVNFYEGTNLVGTGSLGANGTLASVTLSGVTSGAHVYTAKYPGDSTYNALTFGSVTVNVASATLTSSTTMLSAPATAVYGTLTNLSATVSGSGSTPGGTVAFYDGQTLLGSPALASGAASLSVQLAGGPHTLSAVYSGDANFAASTSANASFTVTAATSMTTVSANPATIYAGGSTTLTATVAGVSGSAMPSGMVSFADGGTSLGNATLVSGVATLTTTLTTVGSRTITATYSGDTNYAVSSGMTGVTVNSNATATALNAPSSLVYGTLPTLSVTVTNAAGMPTGLVTFYDGSTSLGSATLSTGTASLALTTALAGGSHSLKAVYGGDTTFAGSTSATATANVTAASSSTVVKVNVTSVAVGGSVTLTATVAGVIGGATPTGTVTFSDGATSLGSASLTNGVASVTVALPNAGTRTLTASYAGDTNYGASSGSVSETVSLLSTTTSLVANPVTTYPGASVALVATVSGPSAAIPAGTVTFYSGASVLGTASVNTATGVASYTLNAGTAGAYSLTAVYGGGGNYAGSTSAAATLNVVTAVTPTVSPTAISIAPGGSGTVTLTLSPAGGYTGTVALSCSSPVTYVTCAVSSASTTISGATASTVTGTISVAATKSAIERLNDGTVYAWILPAGLLGLAGVMRRRKLLRGALLLAAIGFVGLVGMTGCGASQSASGTQANKPTGSTTVTFSATAGGSTQSAMVTVNITN